MQAPQPPKKIVLSDRRRRHIQRVQKRKWQRKIKSTQFVFGKSYEFLSNDSRKKLRCLTSSLVYTGEELIKASDDFEICSRLFITSDEGTGDHILSQRNCLEFKRQGFTVIDEFIPKILIKAIREICRDNRVVWREPTPTRWRGDKIAWLESGEFPYTSETFSALLKFVSDLKDSLRRHVRLRDDYIPDEHQLAVYQPNTEGYTRHLDASALGSVQNTIEKNPINEIDRRVTVTIYLQDDWQPSNRGLLRIWRPAQLGGSTSSVDIEPLSGRCVLFLSGAIQHQVLPIKECSRMAFTTWFY